MANDKPTDLSWRFPARLIKPHRLPQSSREDIEFQHWSFREVESILAACYYIASSKRTTFAARLKNFHRLRFPLGFKTEQGKTAKYTAGDLAMMALALEMTSLGLQPERIVRVLTGEWYPTCTALRMAATALLQSPDGFDPENERPETDPLSMFLYFDPSALSPLTFEDDPRLTPDIDDAKDSYFYGGQGVVRDNIVKWTSGPVSRISMINVTSMLDRVVWLPDDLDAEQERAQRKFRRDFFLAIQYWAEDIEALFDEQGGGLDAKSDYLWTYFIYLVPPGPWDAEKIERTIKQAEADTAMGEEFIRHVLTGYIKQGAPNVR